MTDEFRIASRTLADLEALETMAVEALANHFSCLRAMLSSIRPDFMADCADAYRRSVVKKCEMGFEVVVPVVLSLNGVHQGSETERDIRGAGQ